MKLKKLRESVRTMLDEYDSDGYFTDEEIDVWLNEGQYDMTNHGKHLKQTSTLLTWEEHDIYNLPDDFLAIFGVEYKGRKLDKITHADIGDKRGYLVWGETIRISPEPQEEEEITLHYYRFPELMESDDDEPEIPYQYRHLLIEYAVSKACEKDEMYDKSNLAYQKYMNGLQRFMVDSAPAPYPRQAKVTRR